MKLLNQGLICLSIGAGILMISCANESPWENGHGETDGKIELNLSADSRVQLGTRAEGDNEYAESVDPSKFSISLRSNDGSYDRTWETLEAFNKIAGFPQGNYKLKATYGSLSKEGFGSPYYVGESDVTVKLGETVYPSITATLGNAMVSIKYSEEFTSMYTNGYSAEVQTTGNPSVAFVNGETRAAYFVPGTAQLYINMTNSTGATVKVNPTSLSLTARHHYIVTVGVNTNDRGSKFLDIQVTEEITEEEPIPINLTDDLFTTAAPEVTAHGFISGDPIEFWQTMSDENLNPELHVKSLAGIASATLTLTAENGGVLPANANNSYVIELVNISSNDKTILSSAKINCYGFYENAGEFGVINFADYLKNLSQGEYSAYLVVKDILGRTSATSEDLQILKANVKGIEYDFDSYVKPTYMGEQIEITIKSNCDKLDVNKFLFDAQDGNRGISKVKGVLKDGPVDKQDGYFYYTFTLSTEKINDNLWTVQGKYADLKQFTRELEVVLPQFEILTDSFAKRVKIKFVNNDPEIAKLVAQNVNIFDGKSNIPETRIDRKTYEGEGIIIVTGLDSDTDYNNWIAYLGSKTTDKYPGSKITSFITEKEEQVPNGDFSNVGRRITSEGNVHGGYSKDKYIQIGGKWYVSNATNYSQYTNWGWIDIYEPDSWYTINDITCNFNSSNLNTWYVVPSTFVNDGKVVIRTVGYNNNGSGVTAKLANAGKYYNSEPPTDLLKRAGELTLKSNSNVESNGQNGIEFSTRPSALVFDYIYNGVGSETAEVNIILIDQDGKEISNKKILGTGQENSSRIDIPDFDFSKSATKLFIEFKSSNSSSPEINIPSDLNEGTSLNMGNLFQYANEDNRQFYPKNDQANSYKSLATGSELIIDNVRLVYE